MPPLRWQLEIHTSDHKLDDVPMGVDRLDIKDLTALTLRQWREFRTGNDPAIDYWRLWEPLRPHFAFYGLELFVPSQPGLRDLGTMRAKRKPSRGYDGCYQALKGDVRSSSQQLVSPTTLSR